MSTSAHGQLCIFLVSINQGFEDGGVAPYLDDDSHYDSFVIVCENADVARRTHPREEELDWWTTPRYKSCPVPDHTWVKPEDVKKLEVTFLGVAHPNVEKGIQCASFNYGW